MTTPPRRSNFSLIDRLPLVCLCLCLTFSKLEWPTSANEEGHTPLVDNPVGELLAGRQVMHKMKELTALCVFWGIRLEGDDESYAE